MNRHEEAIETIWVYLQAHRDEMISAEMTLRHIEETLTMTENLVAEDQEKQHQVFLAEQAEREGQKGYHHV